MADLHAPTPCIAVQVLYFAVYPGGRRCAVDLASVEKNREQWAAEGVLIETDVIQHIVPVFGKMNFKPV